MPYRRWLRHCGTFVCTELRSKNRKELVITGKTLYLLKYTLLLPMEHELRTYFTRYGFPEEAAALYQAVLAGGHLGVSDIARTLTMHRPAVYDLVARMEQAGFIVQRPSGKRMHYSAAPPSFLAEYARGAAAHAADLAALLAQKYVAHESPAVRVLEGKDGIAGAYMDVVLSLPHGASFYHYTAVADQKKVDAYVPREYREVRDRKQLERLTIASEHARSKKQPRLERYVKVFPGKGGAFAQNVDVFIYGSKVSIFSFDSERAVIIDDERFAGFHRDIFKRLFKALE